MSNPQTTTNHHHALRPLVANGYLPNVEHSSRNYAAKRPLRMVILLFMLAGCAYEEPHSCLQRNRDYMDNNAVIVCPSMEINKP